MSATPASAAQDLNQTIIFHREESNSQDLPLVRSATTSRPGFMARNPKIFMGLIYLIGLVAVAAISIAIIFFVDHPSIQQAVQWLKNLDWRSGLRYIGLPLLCYSAAVPLGYLGLYLFGQESKPKIQVDQSASNPLNSLE